MAKRLFLGGPYQGRWIEVNEDYIGFHGTIRLAAPVEPRMRFHSEPEDILPAEMLAPLGVTYVKRRFAIGTRGKTATVYVLDFPHMDPDELLITYLAEGPVKWRA